MAVTIANQLYDTVGTQRKVTARITLDNSYPTGGYTLTAAQFAMSRFVNILSGGADGYMIDFGSFASQPESILMPVYSGAAGTTGATSGGTPGAQTFTGTPGTVPAQVFTGTPGTVPAQVFTGTSPATSLDLATPAFSGTGLTAAGQVITTTDNQTMALNQCAGMWLISATGTTPPNLILSNTNVAGAPAVLTVQGSANTDAGAYKIVKGLAPVGTNGTAAFTPAGTNGTAAFTPAGTNSASAALATHTHSVGAAAGGEVTNGTNLSTVSFEVEVYGY